MNEDFEPDELLDLWFESYAWKTIIRDATEYSDPDSIALMEQVNDQLASVIFHLQNESGPDRIHYELMYFQNLCNDFNVLDEDKDNEPF